MTHRRAALSPHQCGRSLIRRRSDSCEGAGQSCRRGGSWTGAQLLAFSRRCWAAKDPSPWSPEPASAIPPTILNRDSSCGSPAQTRIAGRRHSASKTQPPGCWAGLVQSVGSARAPPATSRTSRWREVSSVRWPGSHGERSHLSPLSGSGLCDRRGPGTHPAMPGAVGSISPVVVRSP